MVVNSHVEHPEPDDDNASHEALLNEPGSKYSSLPWIPPPQKAEQFCPLPGQVRHLKWCLTMFFAHHWDDFYMYVELGNDEHTEMQLKFHDLPNPSLVLTTPKVGVTGLNFTEVNDAVITRKFWVLNTHQQAFVYVVRLGQHSVPHTWLLNTGYSSCDNRPSDLHQLSGVAQLRVLHGLMSRMKMTSWCIYQTLACRKEHM